MKILETERLYLREMDSDDAKSAYDLNSDPEVICYTGDIPFASVKEAHDFLEAYTHYKIYGFGRWAVIEKTTNNFLGWCGLKFTPDLKEYDIGFRFFKKYWNKGFATEAAKACIELGFGKFEMQIIVGRAMPENKASIKVLTKLGLVFLEERITEGKKEIIYQIVNPASQL
ncbi:GNAT family N-acetyltransferase [Sphingobacteriaceae bacterium]|nr:GNAT family N-acetyltransferase [Sphingobacteriaceae bacterium]